MHDQIGDDHPQTALLDTIRRRSVGGIHGPGIQYAAASPGAIVQTYCGSININANGGEQTMSHAKYWRAAQNACESDHRSGRTA
jgi:hypothetical protein